MRVERSPEGLAALAPLFADFGAQIDALYAEFTDEQLQTILRFMTEITQTPARRDGAAWLRLGAGQNQRPINLINLL